MPPIGPDLVRLANQDIALNSLYVLNNATVVGNLTVSGTKSGGVRPVVTAAATLTAAQSGSLCLMNSATGILYTLPAPAVGLEFDFYSTVTTTSGSSKIITDAGTTFILGAVHAIAIATTPSSTAGPFAFSFNGTSHISALFAGTTTGGLIGTYVRLTCVTATQWAITGMMIGSGNLATPASVS